MLKVSVWCVAMLVANVAMAEQMAPPPASAPASKPANKPANKPRPAPKVTVVMTAATLADDCGGTAPAGAPTFAAPPPPVTASKTASEQNPALDPGPRAKADADYEPTAKAKRERRRCEQTSMQLSATAAAGAKTTTLRVKKVELFDDSGTSLGVLTATTPRVWSVDKGAYQAWNGSIAAGQTLNISYVLSQPALSPVGRHDLTYTVRATVTVGGDAQTVSKDVQIVAPTILPPNVKT